MDNYVIITDSTTDLPEDLIQDMGVVVLPLSFNIDGKEYRNWPDGRELSSKDFYAELRKGNQAGTAAINVNSFIEILEPYLKAGTDILYIGFSSALSGTCSNGFLAIEELRPKYPERKLLAVDSLAASMGEGLLVYLATQEKKKGHTIEEVFQFVTDNRLHLCHWFTVDDLNHLKRGGRVSATAALLGTVLGIKPILHVDDEGRLIPVSKTRGRRQSLEQLVTKMAETAIKPGEQTIFISHGDCIDDAKYVESLVKNQFGVKTVLINYVGPVIGAHSGPGTVALFFLGSKR